MENYWIAAGAVLPLMIYMAIGLLARRKYHFNESHISNFNKIVFGVFLPTNMFYSVYFTDIGKVMRPGFVLFAVGALLTVFVTGWVLVTALVKDNKKRGAMIQAFYRSNFILLGVPLVENLYGTEAAAVPLMLCAIIIPIYNVLAVFTRHLQSAPYPGRGSPESHDHGSGGRAFVQAAALSAARGPAEMHQGHCRQHHSLCPDRPGCFLYPPGGHQ